MMFEKYFEQGLTTAQASRHHIWKMDLCEDLSAQANHAINPSLRAISYMRQQWLKREHGGYCNLSMAEALKKYAVDNPDVTLLTETINNQLCVVLVTPFMKRVHKELREAGEVVFVDATGSVDQLNTAVFPFLCAGPAGAVPLAVLFTSAQDEETLIKGFGLVKLAVGESSFYGQGAPQSFMTDNSEAERKALTTVWPGIAKYLCIFHVLQQVWRWLLDGKHGVGKTDRQKLMGMVKQLVYAKTKDKFFGVWTEFQACPEAVMYPSFTR
ncbi:hypothetical protein Pmani_025206 [Petrolisthes manimaculis]|uniref:MULE transposase domain-containing protein n=1 Tax=Petrolisthes manimaculis TaxID=1843537 RepID=A0AAE1P8Q0_9EUCA|nr:hypothetical protein Pmani_025206 [Petrolisthes manimaculis]